MAYVKAGEGAREFRELPCPLALNGGAEERNDREDADVSFPEIRWTSLLSRDVGPEGPDHSLSVVGEVESSRSPRLLPPAALVDAEADPDARLAEEELAASSFPLSFSFSSKSMKIRERASL